MMRHVPTIVPGFGPCSETVSIHDELSTGAKPTFSSSRFCPMKGETLSFWKVVLTRPNVEKCRSCSEPFNVEKQNDTYGPLTERTATVGELGGNFQRRLHRKYASQSTECIRLYVDLLVEFVPANLRRDFSNVCTDNTQAKTQIEH